MTDVSTAAVAGNVFHNVGIRGVELIRRLHAHRRGLNFHRHVIQWRHGKMDFI
jgi:hypothetical protein